MKKCQFPKLYVRIYSKPSLMSMVHKLWVKVFKRWKPKPHAVLISCFQLRKPEVCSAFVCRIVIVGNFDATRSTLLGQSTLRHQSA